MRNILIGIIVALTIAFGAAFAGSVEVGGPNNSTTSPVFGDVVAVDSFCVHRSAGSSFGCLTGAVDSNFIYIAGDQNGTQGVGLRLKTLTGSSALYVDSGDVALAGGRFSARSASGGISIGTAGTAVLDIPAGTSNVNWVGATHTHTNTIDRAPSGVFSCPDNGGGTAAACTITTGYTFRMNAISCLDANGCNMTMSETSIGDGETACYWNQGTNTVNFADTAGVTELSGAIALGQYDNICLYYAVDRWIQISTTNN